jgi:hypothetical protein
MVSDVDESIDFSCPDRTQRFMDFVNSQERNRSCWISRTRYWYDFDNLCFLKSIRIPLVRAGQITDASILPQSRHYHDEGRTYYNENPLAFEYSYCFKGWDKVQRKHITYAHTGLSDTYDVQRGLSLNAWIRSKNRGEKRGPEDFFEIIPLTEQNSPKYVRDNLEVLRTGIVDPNYKENRVNTPEIYV